jgi:hypothetical protein
MATGVPGLLDVSVPLGSDIGDGTLGSSLYVVFMVEVWVARPASCISCKAMITFGIVDLRTAVISNTFLSQ